LDILIVAANVPRAERELLDRVLAENCVGIKSVSNYAQALEALARRKHRIVVLAYLDTQGEFRTAEAIRIMKEIVPEVLIIVVSDELAIEEERKLRESGLYFYLTRPLDEVELRDVLAGAITIQTHGRTPS